MSLAKQINEKLDLIIKHNKELEMVEKDYNDPDFELKDPSTGKLVSKEIVLNKAQEQYDQIIGDLNQITNNGKNVRNIFDNPYYINDSVQDKIIAQEIMDNKLQAEQTKQEPNNN
jgi:hypothetical protein